MTERAQLTGKRLLRQGRWMACLGTDGEEITLPVSGGERIAPACGMSHKFEAGLRNSRPAFCHPSKAPKKLLVTVTGQK